MKKIIVMVDDHIGLLEDYIEVLEEYGLTVVSFSNPVEAKRYLMTTTEIDDVHAIVSDIMMGPTDGLEFLHFVKTIPELEDIDFYLVTGAAVSVFEPLIAKSKIKGLIEKPFTAKHLVNTLLGFEAYRSHKSA